MAMKETRHHSHKDTALEALLGIAAVIAVFPHNRLAFLARRYRRLLGPGLVSYLLPVAFFQVGADHDAEVATAIKSPWLVMFGYSIPPNPGFQPLFVDAFRNGAFDIEFIPYHPRDNRPLWTTYFETTGRFLFFELALCVVIARRFNETLMGFLLVIALAASFNVPIFYAACIVLFHLSVVAALLAAFPTSAFDRRWTAAVNGAAAFLIGTPALDHASTPRQPYASTD